MAECIRFHVAVDGDDSHPGTEDAPFATLHGARDAVRALGAHELPVEVVVGGGTYYFDEPLYS